MSIKGDDRQRLDMMTGKQQIWIRNKHGGGHEWENEVDIQQCSPTTRRVRKTSHSHVSTHNKGHFPQ